MPKLIVDQYTELPISRQRRYQLRKQKQGRCAFCGAPAANSSRCPKHLILARERTRKKQGCKARRFGALSYALTPL